MVVSHWEGDHCVAATPVRVDQLGELAELVVTAFARSVEQAREAEAGDVWPAPRAGDVVFVDRLSSGAEARPA